MTNRVLPPRLRLRLFAAAACSLFAGELLAGQPQDAGDPFVRLRRGEDKQPIALETAIASFTSRSEHRPRVTIDLVGAIHIADKQYYEQLNQRFKTYDAVLYELVAQEDVKPQPGSAPASAVSGLQVSMKALLGLAFQLDHIDYQAKNMVHADMNPEEFATSMKNRNESFVGMFFRIMGRGFADQAKDPLAKSDLRVLAALFATDRAYQIKLVMAEQFADVEGDLDLFSGPEGSTIVTERNKKALEILTRELGRGRRQLAIFYGAAHLPDLQARLEKDFAMQRVKTDWIPAWSLVRSSATPAKDKLKGTFPGK